MQNVVVSESNLGDLFENSYELWDDLKKYKGITSLSFQNIHQEEIEELILKYNLQIVRDIVFVLIHFINEEAISWNRLLNQELLHDMKNFNQNQHSLKEVVDLYRRRYKMHQESDISYDLKSISFEFSHMSKTIKVSNFFLLLLIMERILEHDFDTSMTQTFSAQYTRRKEIIAYNLFKYIDRTRVLWNASENTTIYEIIAELFTYGGVKTSENNGANADNIKTWYFNEKRRRVTKD